MNSYSKALYFFRDAYSILYDHCPRMLAKSEWNLAGKTAYDAMEKVAKSVELLAEVHKTRQHDVRLYRSILDRLPLVAWRVDCDPLSSVSLCVMRISRPDNHVRLFKAVNGTMTLLGAHCVPSLSDITLAIDGSTVTVCSLFVPVLEVTDTSSGLALQGHWFQCSIEAEQLDILNKYLADVSSGRNTSGYYAEVYSQKKATEICRDGKRLFAPVKRNVGHRIGGPPAGDIFD